MSDALNTLLELEHAGWTSLCEGSGHRFYAEMMTEDARMVLADGTVMDRAQVVDALGGAPPWDSYALDDVTFLPLGADGAVLLYTGTARDGDRTFVAVMASVYRHEADGWKLVLYQQTGSAGRPR